MVYHLRLCFICEIIVIKVILFPIAITAKLKRHIIQFYKILLQSIPTKKNKKAEAKTSAFCLSKIIWLPNLRHHVQNG
jgi:hypothetical protein